MDAPSKNEVFLVVIIGTTLLFDDFSREGSAFCNLSIVKFCFLIKINVYFLLNSDPFIGKI